MSFRKVLVANRGEIAVRLICGLREAGIRSVAIYSDADRLSLHTQVADEAVHIGPSQATQSYLSIDKVVEAARQTGADAIHPGYGFLSENAEFAAACESAGLTFIGPPSSAIALMGSKTRAREVAQAAGAPIVPGSSGDAADLHEMARRIGFPVMVKASAGGGGKGMRRVDTEPELQSALETASSEALSAFRNGHVYIEKLLLQPRHVEVQILADNHGHVIHLGERECSLQRRHQKVVEESPSPLMQRYPELRAKMGEAAVAIAKRAGYCNAGTIEFLVDQSGNFYFLEMNTRLQVEHPVTELVTGIDLVQWQLRIAAGEKLTLQQDEVRWHGSSIQCRLYAEDPDNGFFPSPGRITSWEMAAGPGVRVDSGVFEGWDVPLDYDPLLAKLIVWAPDRASAVDRMARAVDDTHIGGIRSNVDFFRSLFRDKPFRAGDLHTGFIEEFLERRSSRPQGTPEEMAAAIVLALRSQEQSTRTRPPVRSQSRWLSEGRSQLLR